MTVRIKRLLAIAFAMALLATACGGDDDDGGGDAGSDAAATQTDDAPDAGSGDDTSDDASGDDSSGDDSDDGSSGDDSGDGSSGDDSGDDSSGDDTSGEADGIVAEATAAATQNLVGTDRPLPASSPPIFEAANVWLISCTQTAPGCAAPAAGFEEAGGELGWDVTIFDGQGTPDVFAEGIRSAIADGADAIVLDAVDCVLVTAALQEARDAGVIIFATASFDCDDPLVGGEALFDGQLQFDDAPYIEFARDIAARSAADYVIANTNGEAKVVALAQSDALIGQHLYSGFAARIAECDTC